MNHHELRRRLNRAEVTAATLNTRLASTLSGIRQAQVDQMRAVSYDGAHSTSGLPDPTGTAAMLVDRAADDRREMERQITLAATALSRAAEIAAAYLPPDAKATEVLRKLGNDRNAEPGCQCCASVDLWSPVHRSGDVDGKLAKPVALCRACYRFVGLNDRLPSIPELEAGRSTGKLKPFEHASR